MHDTISKAPYDTHESHVPKHFPYSDILFDYAQYMRDIENHQSIGTCTDAAVTVAILGTGAAGIISAYELLRSGVKNVHLYTPDDITYRPYGRCHSVAFEKQTDPKHPVLAEMGAMRFPVSSVILFHYLHTFDIAYTERFPNPGKVNTLLRTNGKSHVWKANTPPPPIFTKVAKGWESLINAGFTTHDGIHLTAPAKIAELLKQQQTQAVIPLWQQWIDRFEGLSFRASLGIIFQQSATPPGGEKWSEEDMQLFGTLGVGSGGFNPFYGVSFIHKLNLFNNALETNQQFIPMGIQSVIDTIASHRVGPYNQCVKDTIHHMQSLRINTHIITDTNGKKRYVLQAGNHRIECDYIICALPTWALQVHYQGGIARLESTHLKPQTPVFGTHQLRAISQQHLVAASKIFVQTKTKFWLRDPECFPNIQSDTISRGFYCLDYNPNDPDGYGVVLISYTWEDDAHKISALQGLRDMDKAHYILDTLSSIDGAEKTIAQVRNHMIDAKSIFWAQDPVYHGAFKVNTPGQHTDTHHIYWDYIKSNTPEHDSQVYFAGDSVSFYGGWIEGALQTGLNAASAVLISLAHQGKAKNIIKNNPVIHAHATAYKYSTADKM